MTNIETLQSHIHWLQKHLDELKARQLEPYQSLWFRTTMYKKSEIDLIEDTDRGFTFMPDAIRTPNAVAVRRGKGQIVCDFLNLLAELHSCKGVVAAHVGTNQYTIWLNGMIVIVDEVNLSAKFLIPFPMFDTRENCQAAITKVGADRILRVMKAYHGVE